MGDLVCELSRKKCRTHVFCYCSLDPRGRKGVGNQNPRRCAVAAGESTQIQTTKGRGAGQVTTVFN